MTNINGPKHPQCFVFGAGLNFADEDALAEKILCFDWKYPENMVLVIQPEDGPTRVWRPQLRLIVNSLDSRY